MHPFVLNILFKKFSRYTGNQTGLSYLPAKKFLKIYFVEKQTNKQTKNLKPLNLRKY